MYDHCQSNACLLHNRKYCLCCYDVDKNEFRFVQIFDVLNNKDLLINEIGHSLGYVRIRWKKMPGDSIYGGEIEYGFVSLGTIRGSVHAIRENLPFH